MTQDETRELVSQISYKDWVFKLKPVGDTLYLQVQFKDGEEEWNGRKWLLSPHMTASEIVQTALLAVLTAEEHEAREKFTFRGRHVFGPHIDIEAKVATSELLDKRKPAPLPVYSAEEFLQDFDTWH